MLPFRTEGSEGFLSPTAKGCISSLHPGGVQPALTMGQGLEMISSLDAFPLTTEKVHAEIERVLGPGCLPTFEDRKSMPFTNAVIHEVQRFVTLLPHVPRCTSADTHFKGYFIPKVRAALQPKSRRWHTGQNAAGRFGVWASAQSSVTAQGDVVVG